MAPPGAALQLPLLLLVLGACCARPAAAAPLLSALGRTLVVEASPKAGQAIPVKLPVLHAGEDTITVTWYLNASSPAGADADAGYRAVKVTLCYAPASQVDRGWRKASDDLSKDKACQREIGERPYAGAGTGAGAATLQYVVARDVPTASYYVRAYALGASGAPLGYGQTAPAYFHVAGVTGIHASLRVAAAVFSAFSLAALAFFLAVEKRRKDM
ncbi:hypothetical protein U9M48_032978 [Paspalum notatum var. saurae]|uniref:High-affinity nitrate transporter n=1 Tax=Paspalum notatum var. saurae TaxID=547442 RepID=A0AAQ3U6E1_PASNO